MSAASNQILLRLCIFQNTGIIVIKMSLNSNIVSFTAFVIQISIDQQSIFKVILRQVRNHEFIDDYTKKNTFHDNFILYHKVN